MVVVQGTNATIAKVVNAFGHRLKKSVGINAKEKKAVWQVVTERGTFMLKKMPGPPERTAFTLAAWNYLLERDAGVPPLLKSLTGNFRVDLEGNSYILMKKVTGQNPNPEKATDREALMKALARFHKASKGFSPPPEADNGISLIGELPQAYAKKVTDFNEFRAQASQRIGEFSTIYLKKYGIFQDIGEGAIQRLEQSGYAELIKNKKHWVLCHQDFAPGNVVLSSEKSYVYDLDSVRFDLPVRDLRKVINKVFKKKGTAWDLQAVAGMLQAYHQENPLDIREYQVLWADLEFPHLFSGIADKYYRRREREWTEAKFVSRLKEMIAAEKAKNKALAQFPSILDKLFGGGR